MKRTLSLLMAVILLVGVICSCDNNTNNGGGTGKDVIKTDGDYKVPNVNMNGETVTVLNMDEFADMKIDFVVPEDSDDTLDIAIYESNKRLEEQFNFTFVEDEFASTGWQTMYIDMANHLIKNINSGDDVYDFVYFPVNQRMELMTNGYIMDLSELDGLDLDQPWWDQNLNEVINVNGRQYMASGSLNMMPYESMVTVFFNKDLFANYGLDDPYEMVNDGTWTLDKFLELGHEGQSLNADPNWWVYEGGTSTYGFAMHGGLAYHALSSAGVKFVTETDDGFTFDFENDDFYLALEKVAEIYTPITQGGLAVGSAGGTVDHYIKLFSENRAIFMIGELKAGVEMRDSEVNFGILPLPKLRAEQENYVTDEIERLHFVCIPTVSENPEDVAKILDAMAYDRYKNVVPVYYDSYVSYKGLRDEQSLEMLEIMKATRTMDVGVAYGWCSDFVVELSDNIKSKAIASMIAAQEGGINDAIDNFVENYLG